MHYAGQKLENSLFKYVLNKKMKYNFKIKIYIHIF